MKSEVFNQDCLAAMRRMPDKAFDLAIVDPPYGIARDGTLSFRDDVNQFSQKFRKVEYAQKDWDKAIPSAEYFIELRRVSRNQIIWGANYFIQYLPKLNNFIYWHKKGKSNDQIFNEGEMAYTSQGRTVMVDLWWNGVGIHHSGETKIHPTQKPVALYKWLLTNYAKPGDSILDTHLGSQSSRIAAYDLGFDFTGYELDPDYFKAGCERFERHAAQPKLFEPEPQKVVQGAMFATV